MAFTPACAATLALPGALAAKLDISILPAGDKRSRFDGGMLL